MTDAVLTDEPKRQRKTSIDTRDRRAVRLALSGVRRRFTELQREAAFLNALSARSSRPDDYLPRIVSLGSQVQEVAGLLDAAVTSLTAEQRGHSLIVDLQKALAHLRAAIPSAEGSGRAR